MRQLAEGGHISPRQKTPDGGTQSSSDVEMPSRRASTIWNTPVCLPLLSESKKLLWVHSRQIDLPADLVAELDRAFDRFPYLTHRQTAALAQRCSLHPDQVKVWFMAQRLQYGISWDYKDICDVWNKFKSSDEDAEGNRGVQNRMDGEMQGSKRKQKEKGGEEKSPKEGRMTAQKVSANEKLERNTKPKQPTKKEEPRKEDEDKANTPKKRKTGAGMDEGRKKREKQDNHNEGASTVEVNSDKSENEGQAFTKTMGAVVYRRKKKAEREQMSNQMQTVSENHNEPDVPLSASVFVKPPTQTLNTNPLTENQTDPQHGADASSATSVTTPVNSGFEGKPEASAGLQEDLHTEAPNPDIAITDVQKLKELTAVTYSLAAADEPAVPTRSRCKTQPQLAMMKMAFLHCQYPDSEQYTWLAVLTEVPRHVLVQWYSDMRYSLKRARPRWMTEEQYKQALSNIKYHQYVSMRKMSKGRPYGSYTAWMRMLERCKSLEEKENEEASELKTESALHA
ncbi:homeobox and leucine zipper encoding b [Kryptolebias marmoratus]|uniref:homeobox and leucine zipper encoding b n=1 Tax=Kryptolebias marmoratus TaxID=37003 RepID=UPI0007F8A111|nr:homeobox and leucine zipper encoding b [Kryptolebias marmoratus]